MPKRLQNAAIYCRISSDRAGDELGVDRQRTDCEALAEARGWNVAAVYVDNDVSAYSGKRREGYDRMLEALKAGEIGAVVAWHPDRLHRSPIELEHFIDVVNIAGADVATVQAGEYDLATAAGRMTARVVGAVARHESEQKSERLKRQRDQMALQGRPHGGRRAYGYDKSGAQVVEAEAEMIREAAARIAAGESLRTIAFDWSARDVASTSGKPWSVTTLRSMMTGPRLAGLRVHRGEVVGDGEWPAILTREEHDQVVALLGNPRVHRVGRPVTSLLGGLVVCACGAKMHHSTRPTGARRYVCAKTPQGGCGKAAIQAERLEEIVVEVVMRRLDTPRLAREVNAKPSAAGDIAALEARLDDLADAFAAGEISRRDWSRARQGIEERLARARRERDDAASAVVLAAFDPGVLQKDWPNLAIDQRRAVLSAVIEAIRIGPARRSGQFDPDRISIDWRA